MTASRKTTKTKAAIVGAGQIARQHLACLRQLPDVDVVGVCDLSRAMAEAAAHQFEIPRWFTSLEQMLDETCPDVLHVTTPPESHYALAKQALEARTHVFIEKPATEHVSQLEELMQRASSTGRFLLEDHNYLFNRSVQRVLQWIGAGRMGQIVHAEVHCFVDIGGEGSVFADHNLRHPALNLPGGAITDFLPHLAYLAIAAVGPHESAQVSWQKRDVDSPLPYDEMRALLECQRGTATLNFSSGIQPDAFFIRVYGTRMRAEAHLFEPRLTAERIRAGGGPLMPIANGLDVAWRSGASAAASLVRKLNGGPGAYEGLWELLRRLYSAVRDTTPPPVSPSQVLETARLVDALTTGGD